MNTARLADGETEGTSLRPYCPGGFLGDDHPSRIVASCSKQRNKKRSILTDDFQTFIVYVDKTCVIFSKCRVYY